MYAQISATIVLLFTTSATAQHTHEAVTETGQSQFAAIAEIVTLLRENPGTDWTTVNIDGLREHLVDMNNVTTRTSVDMTINDTTVMFRITGDAESALSARRMVVAHAPMLEAETGWSVSATPTPDGIELAVITSSMDAVSQVEGLGFFGLMTIGAHHQQHHLMMARGLDPH